MDLGRLLGGFDTDRVKDVAALKQIAGSLAESGGQAKGFLSS